MLPLKILLSLTPFHGLFFFFIYGNTAPPNDSSAGKYQICCGNYESQRGPEGGALIMTSAEQERTRMTHVLYPSRGTKQHRGFKRGCCKPLWDPKSFFVRWICVSIWCFKLVGFHSAPASVKAFMLEISKNLILLPGVKGETDRRVN